MAGDLNRCTLVGRLGADPEIKSFQNGGRICNLRMATSEKWKDRQTGEQKERTEWHSVTVRSDGLIGVCERFLKKGSRLLLEGQLQTRKWQDKSGNDRYTTEIVLHGPNATLIMLDGPGGAGAGATGGQSRGGWGDGGGAGATSQQRMGGAQAGGKAAGGGERSGAKGGWADDLDDDIPF